LRIANSFTNTNTRLRKKFLPAWGDRSASVAVLDKINIQKLLTMEKKIKRHVDIEALMTSGTQSTRFVVSSRLDLNPFLVLAMANELANLPSPLVFLLPTYFFVSALLLRQRNGWVWSKSRLMVQIRIQ
jgi:hypothetical protein